MLRRAQTQLFSNTAGGLPGNDDLGAMGSWYVWSALGLYPLISGTDTLVIGSPLFPRAVVHLSNGRDIRINAQNAAIDAPYVQGLQLNGDNWPKTRLNGNQYLNGATLSFDLGATPNTSWGSGPSAAPPSDGTGQTPAIPYLSADEVTLRPGQTSTVTLHAHNVCQESGRLLNGATSGC